MNGMSRSGGGTDALLPLQADPVGAGCRRCFHRLRAPVEPSRHARIDPAATLYQGAAGRAYHEGKRELRAAAEPWVFALRAEKFACWVRAGDTVFELGVGSGWNLAHLRCARRIGADAATFLADRVRALGIEFVAGTHEVPDASVEVAICHHTLEHLLDPPAALNELARVLRPGGRLVLHVPWEVERRYAQFDPAEPNHHLYHWNAQNLGRLVTTLGWQVRECRARRYGYDRFAANLAARARLGERGFRAVRAALVALRPCREIELVAERVA